MTPAEITAQAEAFWALAGLSSPTPLQLEAVVYLSLPVAITRLPRLLIEDVDRWLSRFSISRERRENPQRDLHACLIAAAGKGFVLLNGSDPEDEMRYSLAHEIAHFYLDYWHPRQRAFDHMGPEIAGVLDGDRPATATERVGALLGEVSLGYSVHLLSRSRYGIYGVSHVEEMEDNADRLALELLAPRASVRAAIRAQSVPLDASHITGLLRSTFSLPPDIAESYSAVFVPRPTVRQWLGMKR